MQKPEQNSSPDRHPNPTENKLSASACPQTTRRGRPSDLATPVRYAVLWRQTLLPILCLLLAGCGKAYRVEWSTSSDTAEALLIRIDGDRDTLTPTPGAGPLRVWKGRTRTPFRVLLSGADVRVGFVVEEGVICVDAEGIPTGTPSNDRLTGSRRLLAGVSDPGLRGRLLDSCIASGPPDLGALLLLGERAPELPPSVLAQALGRFPAPLRDHPAAASMTERVTAWRATRPGRKAIALELPDTDGVLRPLDLEWADGPVLLEFRASWCRGPEAPLLPAHTSEGKVRRYRVWLDNRADLWPAAARTLPHGIDVWGVCNGASPAAEAYGVERLPARFLIGRDGRILATDANPARHGRLLDSLP